MISATMKGYCWAKKMEPLLNESNTILEKVKILSSLRNIVDHGTVCSSDGDTFLCKPVPDVSDRDFYLTPAFYNTTNTSDRLGVKVWLNSETIMSIRGAILYMKHDIDRFVHHTISKNYSLTFPLNQIMKKSS